MTPPESPILSMHDWDRVELRLLRYYRGQPATRSSRLSAGGTFAIWYVRAGEAFGSSPQGAYRAGPGQWLLHLPIQREQHFTRDAMIDSVNFIMRWRSGARLLEGPTPLRLSAKRARELRAAFDALLTFAPADHSHFIPEHRLTLPQQLAIQETFFRFTRTLLTLGLEQGWTIKPEKGSDARVSWLLDQLENQPLSQPLDLPDLANQSHLSQAHLTRLFLAEHGVTPRQFFEERRLQYARGQLLRPEIRIKEVASDLGFHSLQRFSVWFKTLEGVAPRDFRLA